MATSKRTSWHSGPPVAGEPAFASALADFQERHTAAAVAFRAALFAAPATPTAQFACDFCTRRFENERGLKRHRHACKSRTQKLGGVHVATDDEPTHGAEPDVELYCDLCNRLCRNERGLKRHRHACNVRHFGAAPTVVQRSEAGGGAVKSEQFKCDLCARFFHNERGLKRHRHACRQLRQGGAALARVATARPIVVEAMPVDPMADVVMVNASVIGYATALPPAGGPAVRNAVVVAVEQQQQPSTTAAAAAVSAPVAALVGGRAPARLADGVEDLDGDEEGNEPARPLAYAPLPVLGVALEPPAGSARMDGWIRRQLAELRAHEQMSVRELAVAARIVPQMPGGEAHLADFLNAERPHSAPVEAVRGRLLRWLEARADDHDEPAAEPAGARPGPERPAAQGGAPARAEAGAASELRRRLWSPDEDALLRRLVAAHGEDAWPFVATQGFVDRTHRQCRMRYVNYLAPGVSLDEYSAEEDARLLASVAELGEGKWAAVAGRLPGRRPDSVRNRWRSLQGRAADAPGAAAPLVGEGRRRAGRRARCCQSRRRRRASASSPRAPRPQAATSVAP